MQDFHLVEQDGVLTLKCKKFEEFEGIRHGFSTRHGGVSSGDCATLSFAYNKESEAVVDENFRRFCAACDLPFDSLVLTHQTHTANVVAVGKDYVNQGRHRKLRETDGLVTSTPGLGLCCFTADCVPVLLADPVNKVVAAVHSGWRGTVNAIAAEAVKKMLEEGAELARIHAAIGPSIGPCCFEVGPEVQAEFDAAFGAELPSVQSNREGHTMVDLWRANELVLEKSGVLKKQIYTAKVCTLCNNSDYFSHRYTNGRRGSMVSAIAVG